MYEAWWQLARRPFDTGRDPAAYYPSETHQGALARLRYAIESARGSALLAGPAGTGKSVLIGQLLRQLPETFAPQVRLACPQALGRELLAVVAAQLSPGRDSPAPPTTLEAYQLLEERLQANSLAGQQAVVVLDEAHLIAGSDAWEAVRALAALESAQGPLVSVLLVGQPSLIGKVAALPSLEERLAMKCALRPFTLEETQSYVQHRLGYAGTTAAVFEPAAVEALHEHSGGSPRRINRLADLALLVGFAEGLSRISATVVSSLAEELLLEPPLIEVE